jgi:hypothetical protein
MKIKFLIIILCFGIILLGLTAGVFLPVDGHEAPSGQFPQNSKRTAESNEAAPISKGTVLMLLAVGVIGALGVSRKKNGNGSHLNRTAADRGLPSHGADKDHRKLVGRSS